MSLTILFKKPVDTGMAKIRPKVENANKKDFYLLTGKLTPVGPKLRRSVRLQEIYLLSPILHLLLRHRRKGAALHIFYQLNNYHINCSSLLSFG